MKYLFLTKKYGKSLSIDVKFKSENYSKKENIDALTYECKQKFINLKRNLQKLQTNFNKSCENLRVIYKIF